MWSCWRIARTSGTSTTCTRAPAFLPSTNSAASFMPCTRSRLNLFISPSASSSHGALDACREFRQRLLRLGRHIVAHGLGVDHEQEQRRYRVVVKVDHPRPSPLAHALAPPAQLAHATRLRDQIPHFRIAGDIIHEFLPLGLCPYIRR